jgi:phage tail tube protein FII
MAMAKVKGDKGATKLDIEKEVSWSRQVGEVLLEVAGYKSENAFRDSFRYETKWNKFEQSFMSTERQGIIKMDALVTALREAFKGKFEGKYCSKARKTII